LLVAANFQIAFIVGEFLKSPHRRGNLSGGRWEALRHARRRAPGRRLRTQQYCRSDSSRLTRSCQLPHSINTMDDVRMASMLPSQVTSEQSTPSRIPSSRQDPLSRQITPH
jgi:hypothetical protein